MIVKEEKMTVFFFRGRQRCSKNKHSSENKANLRKEDVILSLFLRSLTRRNTYFSANHKYQSFELSGMENSSLSTQH